MTQLPDTLISILTPEEAELLDEFVEAHHLTTSAEIIRALLQEVIRLDEALWDVRFAMSQDVLDKLAEEGHADYLAGRTEPLDLDKDFDDL